MIRTVIENGGVVRAVGQEADDQPDRYGEDDIVMVMVLQGTLPVSNELRESAHHGTVPIWKGRWFGRVEIRKPIRTYPISNQTSSNEHCADDRG